MVGGLFVCSRKVLICEVHGVYTRVCAYELRRVSSSEACAGTANYARPEVERMKWGFQEEEEIDRKEKEREKGENTRRTLNVRLHTLVVVRCVHRIRYHAYEISGIPMSETGKVLRLSFLRQVSTMQRPLRLNVHSRMYAFKFK